MEHNVKYRLEYTSKGNYTTKIEILVKDFDGSSIELTGHGNNPFELVYESSDGKQFSTFINSYATLTVRETQLLKNDFQEIEDEDNYYLKYYRDNVLKWSGYLLQEQYTENDDNNQPFISLKFYDAISRLKIYTIDDLDLPQANKYSLYDVFSAINSKLYSNITPSTDILFNRYLTNENDSDDSLLEYIHLKRKSFFDSDNIQINLYDVLERIAQSFNFTFLLYVDRLAIHNFEYGKNPRFLDYGNNKNNRVLIQHTTIDPNHFWINKSRFTTFRDAVKKLEVYHRFGEAPDYFNIDTFDDIVKQGDFTTADNPEIDLDSVTFNSYVSTNELLKYRDLYVSNASPYQLTNVLNESNAMEVYRLSFNVRLELDYGIDPEDFEQLTENQKQAIFDKITEVEANTTVRGYFQYKTTVDDGTTNYYLFRRGFRGGMGSPYDYSDGNSAGWGVSLTTTPNWMEINGNSGLNPPNVDSTIGFDKLIDGYDYQEDFHTLLGQNKITLSFFHPQVYTNVAALDSGNEIRIQDAKLIISNIKLIRKDEAGIDEMRYEGRTNRNVFNYNLELDKEYFYQNIEPTSYRYSLIQENNQPISPLSFFRKSKDYSTVKTDVAFDSYTLLIVQTLEQLAFQQRNISGQLMVRNDNSFDIFSTLSVDLATCGIISYRLNDKQSVYDVELIEIK